ncbi:hypothetical protein ARC20_08380 [Stenotrophomonas panacihumi]|uniref:Transmembrane protein n=1 Tax=Stenotrophomonas panacihumi TaxID=676599 RepID=A0A0R0AH15_9GAMM|nr:hypothetical protein [Stenotrophomonas panacihumi]KRG44427.1 hypothetical protein ARC20_08380 [Stenotrophomonas panacihumi]PTN54568.1 hypothetical protein C9J98_10050 [Stenotrophomonas panacihumi]
MDIVNVLRWIFAAIIFSALAYLPWHYWELAQLVMHGEAPEGTMGIYASNAQSIWWLMGLGMIIWVPLSLALAVWASWAFMQLTRREQ